MRLKTKIITMAIAATLMACGRKEVEADFNIVPLPEQITNIEG